MALPALVERSKSELLSSLQNMKERALRAKEAAAKPIAQVGNGAACVAGGALGGLVAGMKPSIARVPTDLGLGLVVALPCLMSAGSAAVDALALAGYGMVAGGASRLSQRGVRNWREQRAADGGDSAAAQIVQLQKQLDEARKARDEAPAKK